MSQCFLLSKTAKKCFYCNRVTVFYIEAAVAQLVKAMDHREDLLYLCIFIAHLTYCR